MTVYEGGIFNKWSRKFKFEQLLWKDMNLDLKVEVDWSPFSAAVIEEMAARPKGTVLQRPAISSNCYCSEIQLNQFVNHGE